LAVLGEVLEVHVLDANEGAGRRRRDRGRELRLSGQDALTCTELVEGPGWSARLSGHDHSTAQRSTTVSHCSRQAAERRSAPSTSLRDTMPSSLPSRTTGRLL